MRNIRKTVSMLLAAVMLLGIASFGCFSGIKAQAESAAVFELKKVTESSNKVTVSVDIVSGSINALDFNFITTDNVSCDSIEVQGGLTGVGNKATMIVSAVSTASVTSGTIITAVFTLPTSGKYSISGEVTSCTVTTKDSSGQIVNNNVAATVNGTVSGGSEAETVYAKAPSFEFVKLSQQGNKLTVALNLTSETFRSMNLRILLSEGMVCDSITFGNGFTATPTGSANLSYALTCNSDDPGTVFTAVFTIPTDKETYSISGYSSDCIVPGVDRFGQSVDCRIPSMALGTGLSGSLYKIENVSMNYKDVKKLAPASIPAGSVKKYNSSNTSVVSVDENGNVTATGRGEGSVTCIITTPDGNTEMYMYKVTVSYSILQWIIIIVLFGWIWYI